MGDIALGEGERGVRESGITRAQSGGEVDTVRTSWHKRTCKFYVTLTRKLSVSTLASTTPELQLNHYLFAGRSLRIGFKSLVKRFLLNHDVT